MKALALFLLVPFVSGCAALGIGVQDVIPSMKHCDEVKYTRNGLDVDIRAKCRVPAG